MWTADKYPQLYFFPHNFLIFQKPNHSRSRSFAPALHKHKGGGEGEKSENEREEKTWYR